MGALQRGLRKSRNGNCGSVVLKKMRRSGGSGGVWWKCVVKRAEVKRGAFSRDSDMDSESLLDAAAREYESGSKMTALELFDAVLVSKREPGQKAPSETQIMNARFGKLCCLAAAGQVDSAKAALRSAMENGLDYEAAVDGRGDYEGVVRLEGSTQMRRMLSAFAAQLTKQRQEEIRRKMRQEAQEEAMRAAAESSADAAGARSREDEMEEERKMRAERLQRLLDATPSSRAMGGVAGGGTAKGKESRNLGGELMTLDTSPRAIATRVTTIVVLGIVLFPVLFYLGLQLAFPR